MKVAVVMQSFTLPFCALVKLREHRAQMVRERGGRALRVFVVFVNDVTALVTTEQEDGGFQICDK